MYGMVFDGGLHVKGEEGGGTQLLIFVRYRSVDHASLSRRKHRSNYSESRHLQHLGAQYVLALFYTQQQKKKLAYLIAFFLRHLLWRGRVWTRHNVRCVVAYSVADTPHCSLCGRLQ